MAAFVAPAMKLWTLTRPGQFLYTAFMNLIKLQHPLAARERDDDLSLESADVSMMIGYCLCGGFVVPVILPLSFLWSLFHLYVFHHAGVCGVGRVNDAKPTIAGTRLCLVLGLTNIMWFYAETDLHGKAVVLIGVPLMAIAAMALERFHPALESRWACLVTSSSSVVVRKSDLEPTSGDAVDDASGGGMNTFFMEGGIDLALDALKRPAGSPSSRMGAPPPPLDGEHVPHGVALYDVDGDSDQHVGWAMKSRRYSGRDSAGTPLDEGQGRQGNLEGSGEASSTYKEGKGVVVMV